MGTNKRVALTTFDNPYNPFTHFKEWWSFDVEHGYHSAGVLARIAKTSTELSDLDDDLAVRLAVEEIVQENVSGMWRMVEEP